MVGDGPVRSTVGLDIQCLDRIYLNGYAAKLQCGGQVVNFLTHHLGNPIASPAIFEKIGTRFRQDVRRFATDLGIPVVRFKKGDRKIDVMRPLLAKAVGRHGSRHASTSICGMPSSGLRSSRSAPIFRTRSRSG